MSSTAPSGDAGSGELIDLTVLTVVHNDRTTSRKRSIASSPTALSIYASDVAAIAGYNAYADLSELFDKYIYQGCEYLRISDAYDMGLQLVTKAEQVQTLLEGMSSGSEIKEVLKLKTGNKRAKVAGEIAAAVQVLVDDSTRRNEVRSVEDLIVLNSLVSDTYKEFGTENEKNVIDLYELKTGNRVERLDRLLTISVFSEGYVSCNGNRGADKEDEAPLGAQEPQFQIIGRVDGVSAQGGEQVVLEVKNRIRSVPSSPPLKDLIQLVVYLKMLGVQVGHLVQCVFEPDSAASPGIDFGVYSLDLREEPFHVEEFDKSVLPRLRVFCAAVLHIRAVEGARREWLRQDERYRLAVVLSSCDFLEEAVRRCEERVAAFERQAARDEA